MNRELSEKHKAFCQEYIKDFNATQAYIRAGYKGNNDSLGNNACRLMGNDRIAQYIKSLVNQQAIKQEITVEWLLNELKAQYNIIKNEPKYSSSIDKKLEMFGKYLGLWIDKIKGEGIAPTTIVINDTSGLINRAKREFPVSSRGEAEEVAR